MNPARFSKLLYLVLLFTLAACQVQATPSAPTTGPATAAPTAVPATVAPTTAPAEAQTSFSSKTFDLPITFRYGPDWKIDAENSDHVSLTYKDYDGYFSFIYPKSVKIANPAAPYSVIPFPDDFANWIQAHGLFQVVNTLPVLVGGLEGTQIDADATAACPKTNWLLAGTGGWNCGDGGHYRFIYLDDVNGEQLLIMTQGYVSAEDFTFMTDASQKILDTASFSTLTTFSSKRYKLDMRVSFNSDWRILDDYPDLVTVQNKQAGWQLGFNIVTDAKLADPVDGHLVPFPDDFVSWIKSDPNLVAGTATEVLVGGLKGIQIDISSTKGKDFLHLPSGIIWYHEATAIGRFILLNDVNGERVFIWLVLTVAADEFKDALQQAQGIIDSVAFTQ